ncbi:MAG TPA: hypothetical protein VGK61_08245 [Planctomycetota bacterium]
MALADRRTLRLGGELVWVGLGQGLAALGALVGVRVMTGLLPPAHYGEVVLGMTVALLAQQVFFSPAYHTAFRFYSSAAQKGTLPVLLAASRRLTFRSIGWMTAAGIAGGILLALTGQTRWLPLLGLAALYAIVTGAGSVFDGFQSAARHRPVVALHEAGAQWLRFLLAAGVITWLGATSAAAVLGFALSSVVIFISQYLFFRAKIRPPGPESADPAEVRGELARMLPYGLPFAAWGLFTWLHQSSDRWSLQVTQSTETVGLYAALFQIGYYPMAFFSQIMTQWTAPHLFKQAGDASDPVALARARRANRLLVAITLLATVLGAGLALAFHGIIFSILVAAPYREVSPLLPLMVLAGGLFGAGQAASLLHMSFADSRILVKPKIVTALLGIGFNLAGARYLGLKGVVLGMVAFGIVYCLWLLLAFRAGREKVAAPDAT